MVSTFHRHGGRLTNALYRGVETFAGTGSVGRGSGDQPRGLRRGAGTVVPADRLFLTGGVGVSARTTISIRRASRRSARGRFGSEWGVADSASLLTVDRRDDSAQAAERRASGVRPSRAALPRRRARACRRRRPAAGDTGGGSADKLGVADRVRFPGFRRDTAAILAATDVFLFPSAAGRIALRDSGGAVDGRPRRRDRRARLRRPDRRRLRADSSLPGDVDALAETRRRTDRLPNATRQKMGAAGRAAMLARYDRPKCVAEWQAIYDRLLVTSREQVPRDRTGVTGANGCIGSALAA